MLIAPVQFLADHLETLYDIDIGGREQAEAAGFSVLRVAAPNVAPDFAAALASVVRDELSVWDTLSGEANWAAAKAALDAATLRCRAWSWPALATTSRRWRSASASRSTRSGPSVPSPDAHRGRQTAEPHLPAEQ